MSASAGRSVEGAPDLAAVATEAHAWLFTRALPLWSTAGYDAAAPAFAEALDFDGRPLPLPRRLMVQARQVSVFADAALNGTFPQGADIAKAAGTAMIARYLEADERPGWVFSLTPDGAVADGTRDLYAHAFALFALAALHRLAPSAQVDDAVAKTLAVLDGAFADPAHGGWWDALPRADGLRRQNPHMHLFEALIALYEATGAAGILARCRRLDALARQHFITAAGALPELFGDDWQVHPAPGAGAIEAGHQLEWAWLFGRYAAVSGEDRCTIIAGLMASARRTGLDEATGRIRDEAGEDGAIRKATSRSWPHAEALKAFAAAPPAPQRDALLALIARRLLSRYCLPNGGWVDQRDADDRATSARMPASTLYHLYFGFTALPR